MFGENAAKSTTIYTKNNVVFVKKNSNPVYVVKQLEGKNVGLTRGFSYNEKILSNPLILVQYANSDVKNMKKLSYGRIDAFVVEEQSGLAALKESMVKNVYYEAEKPLYGKPVFFAFQNDNEGKKLATKFSLAIEAMKADGTFDKIMTKR